MVGRPVVAGVQRPHHCPREAQVDSPQLQVRLLQLAVGDGELIPRGGETRERAQRQMRGHGRDREEGEHPLPRPEVGVGEQRGHRDIQRNRHHHRAAHVPPQHAGADHAAQPADGGVGDKVDHRTGQARGRRGDQQARQGHRRRSRRNHELGAETRRRSTQGSRRGEHDEPIERPVAHESQHAARRHDARGRRPEQHRGQRHRQERDRNLHRGRHARGQPLGDRGRRRPARSSPASSARRCARSPRQWRKRPARTVLRCRFEAFRAWVSAGGTTCCHDLTSLIQGCTVSPDRGTNTTRGAINVRTGLVGTHSSDTVNRQGGGTT